MTTVGVFCFFDQWTRSKSFAIRKEEFRTAGHSNVFLILLYHERRQQRSAKFIEFYPTIICAPWQSINARSEKYFEYQYRSDYHLETWVSCPRWSIEVVRFSSVTCKHHREQTNNTEEKGIGNECRFSCRFRSWHGRWCQWKWFE